MSDVRAVEIENEIRLKATKERVWRAATTEQLEWYPYTYGQERVKALVFEERVGGQVYEDWGAGGGHLYGTVTHFDRGQTFSMSGQLSPTVAIHQTMTLEEDGEETVMKARVVCVGLIDDEMEGQIRFHGDLSKFEPQLRTYVEGEG